MLIVVLERRRHVSNGKGRVRVSALVEQRPAFAHRCEVEKCRGERCAGSRSSNCQRLVELRDGTIEQRIRCLWSAECERPIRFLSADRHCTTVVLGKQHVGESAQRKNLRISGAVAGSLRKLLICVDSLISGCTCAVDIEIRSSASVTVIGKTGVGQADCTLIDFDPRRKCLSVDELIGEQRRRVNLSYV